MAHKNVKQAWQEMTQESALTVRSRVVERMNRAEAEPSITLPESKAEFPKLLLLDTNIWVALSQVHHGVKKSPTVSLALAAIREAVETKRLVVPITTTNLDEATKHADAAEPLQELDGIEQDSTFGVFGGLGVVTGEENVAFGKRSAVDVAADGDRRAEILRLFDLGVVADHVAGSSFAS